VNLLLIDNKNHMQANPVVTPYSANTDVATVQKELNEGRSVEFTAGTIIDGGGVTSLTVKDNTTLTLANAPANSTTIKVEKNGKLIVNDANWEPGAANDITVDAGGILETKNLNLDTKDAALTVDGTLKVTGNLTVSGTDATKINATGVVTVTGAANLTAAVTGDGTLNIGSFGGTIATSITNAQVKNVNVTGTALTTTVLGATIDVNTTMTFNGGLTLGNTLAVNGNLTINGTVTTGGFNITVAADRTLTLNGDINAVAGIIPAAAKAKVVFGSAITCIPAAADTNKFYSDATGTAHQITTAAGLQGHSFVWGAANQWNIAP